MSAIEDELDDLLGFSDQIQTGEFDPPDNPAPAPPLPGALEMFNRRTSLSEENFQTWMEAMANCGTDEIDETMVASTYPAALWIFRQAALSGDVKATRAIEAWIDWAKPIANRKKPVNVTPSYGSSAFLPREPK